MRYAVKCNNLSVLAYELGAGSSMEQQLLQKGVIRRHPDGTFELFSREAVNGAGETARIGDYFKCEVVNGQYYAHPIQREIFLGSHVHLAGDEYRQNNTPLAVWSAGDPRCAEMDFLLARGLLTIDESDPERYFNACLYGATLSAPCDAVVVFYRIDRSEDGKIQDINFNFVAAEYFEKNYRYCSVIQCL